MANKLHCTQCTKSTSFQSELARHMLTHIGEKMQICSHCKKSFGRAGQLKTVTHSKEKTHIVFNARSHLVGLEIWKRTCSPAAERRPTLAQNVRSHLVKQGTWERNLHKCPECWDSFGQPQHLKMLRLTIKDIKTHAKEVVSVSYK